MATLLTSRVVQFDSYDEDVGSAVKVVGYLVGDITSGPTAVDPAKQALECVGIPARGDGHPDFPTLTVQKRTPKPFKNSRTKMWVLVTFRPFNFEPINEAYVVFDQATVPITCVYDASENPIIIKWKNADNVQFPAWGAQLTDTKSVGTLRAEWVAFEDLRPSLYPFMNCINDNTLKGTAKYTWWVSHISVAKRRFQSGYHAELEMQYDPEGWIQTIPYRDAFGIIPKGVDLKGSIRKGPGYYNGYFRGTKKYVKSLSSFITKIPLFDTVIPDLGATKLFDFNLTGVETPGDPWI